MKKNIPHSVFIFFIVFLLISGLTGIMILNLQINQKNKHSQLSPTDNPITSAPNILTLQLQSPEDNLLTFQSSIVVSGQTAPNTTVLISTNKNNKVLSSEFDGSFSTVIQLDEGVNSLIIAAVSKSGDQKSIEQTIFYSKEKI